MIGREGEALRRYMRPRSSYRVELEALRDRLDVEAFLADVLGITEWEQRGDELFMRCPLPFGLHAGGDRNPSSSFNRVKLLFGCFVCGGGDVIWLTQTILGVERDEALRAIDGSLRTDEPSLTQLLHSVETMWEPEKLPGGLPSYNEIMLRPWLCYAKYLDERGVDREVQRRMRTGVDLENRDRLAENVWVDQPRLVLPHFFQGKLRGWIKRKLDERQVGGKYVNSVGFPKDRTLYAWDELRPGQTPIVVESPMSVLRMMSLGVEGAVATFGSKVTDDQLLLLYRPEQVILFMDADDAGRTSAASITDRLEAYTTLLVVPSWEIWPNTKTDPGDLSAEEIAWAIKQARPAALIERSRDEEARRHGQRPSADLATHRSHIRGRG